MGPPLRIVSVGESTIDHYLDVQREFVGGISLNFAVNAKRCGADSASLVSCVGEDSAPRINKQVEREEVDASHVTIRPGKTARQDIVLMPNGERIFPAGGYRPGVLSDYFLSESDFRFIQNHNILVSACFNQVERLFREVMEIAFEGWRVADFLDLSDFDKNVSILEEFTGRLALAFVSGDQEMAERLRPISEATSCLVVVTLGAEGSVALLNGEPIYEPSMKVDNVVDSTGCGDAFQAAFTVSYWRDRNIRLALKSGAKQAAKAIQHWGSF